MAQTSTVWRKTSQNRPSVTATGGAASRGSTKASSMSSLTAPPAPPQRKLSSIWGIWATRKVARKLTSRLKNRRRPGAGSDRGSKASGTALEPTYRMEPVIKFNSKQVEKVVSEVVETRLQHFIYQPKKCSVISKVLSEEIKERIKELQYDRYKIVCLVTMGQKRNQGVRVTSRCAWDPNVDTYSTYNWENGSAFCCVTVYGVYHE